MTRLGMRRAGAFFVFVSLLASINLVAAPSALAHHPEIAATVRCDGYGGVVIDYVATSWAAGDKGSNADIGIYVNDTWVASGAFTVENGYSFAGTIEASSWSGESVTVMARADDVWGNGKQAGDSRSTSVAVGADCAGTTTQPEPPTTVPGTYVPGNPTCASLGYAHSVKSDPPGVDETVDGVFFDYDGRRSVTVSSDQRSILAVLVKGGDGAQVYTGSFRDLVAPVNNGGQQADISHVTACLDAEETTTTTERETTTTTEGVLDSLVWVNVGRCEDVRGESLTPVWVRVEPAGSATLTLRTPDGPIVFTETGSVRLEPGRYFWSVEVADGYELTGRSEGSFRTVRCAGNDTMVVLFRGECTYDEATSVSTEAVEFRIAPGGTSTVVVEGPGGPYEVKGSGGVLRLEPGTYTWNALAADGYTMVGPSSGTFTVDGCGPQCTAALGDTVWLDTGVRDGLQGQGEDPVPGVVVELLDEEGGVVATTLTDDDGRYLFSGLCPGTYRIRFELPDIPGLDNERWTMWQNGDASFDSNAGEGGLTAWIVVAEGTEDLTWDAGVVGEQVSSTTVTSLPTTSSTTVAATSSTTAQATTSTTLDVLPETTTTVPGDTTTVPPVTATTLPFTGFELEMTALVGAAALAGGVTLLGLSRRREDDPRQENIGSW